MALIGMAVYDTEENGRSELTYQTLWSLVKKVDWHVHRLVCSDNGSCERTQEIYRKVMTALPLSVIHNDSNLGTARAVNQVWKQRVAGENCVKMDNDVVIHDEGWLDRMEECVRRDPGIGIIGLKRKDLAEHPGATDWAKSHLTMLPHKPGESWLVVEKVNHVIGTCQMYSSAALDKIGYLYQMGGLYGFDDALSAVRVHKAGFWCCFLSNVDIDHIDPEGGSRVYQDWKQNYSAGQCRAYDAQVARYAAGQSVYHGPEDA